MAKPHGVLRRPVPELNGLVGRSLGLASGCARRRVIYEETQDMTWVKPWVKPWKICEIQDIYGYLESVEVLLF